MANDIDTFDLTISTQGDTGTASTVVVTAEQLKQKGRDLVCRARICNSGTLANSTNATIAAATNGGTVLKSHTSSKDVEIQSPSAVAATQTLTLTGVAIDGETATIGDRVYEFDTDAAFTQGRFPVDISAAATAAQGTLTVAAQPTADDTMTIGSTVYTFKAVQTISTEIEIGATLGATQANIVARINGTDQFRAVKNSVVSAAAFDTNASVLTARKPGTAGNAIVSTETFTSVSNVFDAATLGTTTAGVDCTAAAAVTALVAAITADGEALVTAADGAGDTVDITAKVSGTAANAYATTETMANASWGAATMAGGVNATPGQVTLSITDATAETVTLRIGAAEFGGVPGDYELAKLDITHAAP